MEKVQLTYALELLIRDSRNGLRVQKNGKPLSPGSITNYTAVLRNLKGLEEKKQKSYVLTASTERKTRLHKSQVAYWQRFYRDFRNYLFADCNAHDNYVSLHMRVLKLTFKYMRQNRFFLVGAYEYIFYSQRINGSIQIFPIELLGEAIQNHEHYLLTKRQHEILAIFLFGISIGLRYSDLKSLKRDNIVSADRVYYLQTISKKTKTRSRVKLPDYAMLILKKYSKRKGPLFDLPELQNFNTSLKEIAKLLGWSWPVQVYSSKNGKVRMEKDKKFHDIISSHMMRRTAITALLTQGVSETTVRQISGHAEGSKEFYRYVQYSQHYVDSQTDAAWGKILAPRVPEMST